MKPPRPFKIYKKRGYSRCDGCQEFKKTNIFYAEGRMWRLCAFEYADYWENTDELPLDFVDYDFKEWN